MKQNKYYLLPENRIQYILTKAECTDVNDLAAKLNLSGAESLHEIIRGDTKMPLSMAITINKAFPELSLDWIMDGEGSPELSEVEFDVVGIPVYGSMSEEGIEADPIEHIVINRSLAVTVRYAMISHDPLENMTIIRLVDSEGNTISTVSLFTDNT